MGIKRITVSNFKSFKELDVELGNFNVLIGANASGKSNFVSVFRFLRDIVDDGLEEALSQQGVEYFRNVRIDPSEPFTLRIISDKSFEFALFEQNRREKLLYIEASEATYEFAIQFRQGSSEFDITKDELTVKCNFSEREIIELREIRKLGAGTFSISNHHGELKYEVESSNPGVEEYDQFPAITGIRSLPTKTLLLERKWVVAFPSSGSFGSSSYVDDIALYDFDPKQPKKAISLIGKRELASDGSNLAVALRNIVEDPEKKRKLSNLVRDLLPFVKDFDVTRFADTFLITRFRETYSGGSYLPASFISDGTINVVALIVALYFEDNSVVVIEEPERNIHPHLISKVMGMLKEVSERKQIIITTQNPEIVRHADLEDILLISRDKEGFSQISRPAEKEGVRTFLENEIGIEELYVRNLLGT